MICGKSGHGMARHMHDYHSYCLLGDAVNMASRMESTGVPGEIQVTRAIVDQVPPKTFQFERRGMVHVKGKGEMETFFCKYHGWQFKD